MILFRRYDKCGSSTSTTESKKKLEIMTFLCLGIFRAGLNQVNYSVNHSFNCSYLILTHVHCI